MTSEGELIDDIVAAIESVAGLHPAPAPALPNATWLSRRGNRSAVDLTPSEVEIHVVAAALPLPPLVEKLTAGVRELLVDTSWSAAALRVVVTGLDPGAFDDGPITRSVPGGP